jgi:hypothetical protein
MNPPKKRKIGNECRVFNEEWTNKCFFGNAGNKAVCHEMQSELLNAIILKGAALRQPPLPQSGPQPKQLPTPGLSEP